MGGVKQDEQEPPQPSIAPAQPGDDGQARPPVRLPHLPVVDEGIYQVGPEFARGGIGRILEGYHRPLGRVVAIKELLEPSAEQEARFIREARITARLEHPAIVPVHDAGRWADKRPFYSMKLVSGRSLLERIGGCGTLAERLGLLHHVTAVAEAIAYAHSLKIINRDVKPATVRIEREIKYIVPRRGEVLANHGLRSGTIGGSSRDEGGSNSCHGCLRRRDRLRRRMPISGLVAADGYRPCPCLSAPGEARLQRQRAERSNAEVQLRPSRPFTGRREFLCCAQQTLELISSRCQLPGRVQRQLG